MGEVVFTSGDRIMTDRGQNDECVECLEKLLEKARAGEIVGVCVGVMYVDRSTSNAIGGAIWHNPMIGTLTRIIHKLMDD